MKKLTRVCVLVAALLAMLGPALAKAAASISKVTDRTAATMLNDGSAAEQAFVFNGLTKGKDLTQWQTGPALRATLQAASGPGGRRLRVSLAQPPSPERGTPGLIYIGQSTKKQLDLATYTSSHHELQILVLRTPVLS